MRILYVAMKHDYGRPEQGLSFEHHTFYESLVGMGHDITYFDFMGLGARLGREAMNRRLVQVAREARPDLLFGVLFEEELDRKAVRAISAQGAAPTVNWFCDDHWRFEAFSRHWAPCFNWAVTTSAGALPKYARIGYANVIKSQWACNHFRYRRLDLPPAHEVTFVGQVHGNRRKVIQALGAAGIAVRAWGRGWEDGRLDQDQMIRVFNQSRINLNLAEASQAPRTAALAFKEARHAVRNWISDRVNVLPGVAVLRERARSRRRARKERQAAAGPKAKPPAGPARPVQIKGRNFEVPGCGGFLLTGVAENLADYYREGREVAVFRDDAELVARVRHYLEHEDERAAIAEAGYRRTLQEHTYVHRFTEVFARMGLRAPGLEEALRGRPPGATVEIG